MTDNAKDRTGAKHRQLTGRVARWTAILTAGVVALSLAYDVERKILTPGPLSPEHRAVKDCGACHSNVGQGQFGWVSAILSRTDSHADNTRCLSCHNLGDAPHSSHSLPASRLKKTTKRKQEELAVAGDAATLANTANGLLDAALGTSGRNHASIGCATCHKEHLHADGAAHTATDRTCNACHQVGFTSFQSDHPDFTGYPSGGPAPIKYDHAKHFSEHFEKARTKQPDLKSMPKTCTDCHTPDARGQKLLLKPFDVACSACHLPQIVGADRATGPKGLSLLALPGLDIETLRSRGAPIGNWPEESEAELSPLMQVLLARDRKRRTMLATINKLDLLDLQAATDTETAAVVDMVWEIKELLHELSTVKVSNLLKRLRAATSNPVEREEITRMLGTLPRDVLLASARSWLPSLSQEIARHQRPGWQKAFRAKYAKRQARKGGGDEARADKPEPAVKPDIKLVHNPKGGRWYVSVLGEIVQEGLEPEGTRKAIRGEVEQPRKVAAKRPRQAASQPAGKTAQTNNDQPRSKPVDDETWSVYGGWYRKDYAIYYRPAGHADNFLRAWLDFSATAPSRKDDNVLAPVFEALTHEDAQGRCIKCHTVTRGPDNTARVVWGARGAKQSIQESAGFTRFSHAPHLSMLAKRGCLTCHELLKPKKTNKAAASNQSKPVPNPPSFKPITKVTCVACHASGKAPQDCRQCHTYHIAPTGPPLTPTRLPVEAVNEQN